MSAVLVDTVAAEIRAELGRQKLSHQHVAVAIGLSRQAASRRIAGEVPFTVAELEAIAQLLGLPVETLLSNPRQHRIERAS